MTVQMIDAHYRTYQDARAAAQAADDRFSALLHAKYGTRAGDMRYRPAETDAIAEAKAAFIAACDARRTAWVALEAAKRNEQTPEAEAPACKAGTPDNRNPS